MNFETVDNKLVKEADEYIRNHRLLELFEVIIFINKKHLCLGFSNSNSL